MTKTGKFGPFFYYRHKNKRKGKNFLDISLNKYINAPFGWEWGNDGSNEDPAVSLIIGGFRVAYFNRLKTGFHLAILGFWWVH